MINLRRLASRTTTYPLHRLGIERGRAVSNTQTDPSEKQRLRGGQFDLIKSRLAATQGPDMTAIRSPHSPPPRRPISPPPIAPGSTTPDNDLLAVITDRLSSAFEAQLGHATITSTVHRCRSELDIICGPALPELLERLARQRLADLVTLERPLLRRQPHLEPSFLLNAIEPATTMPDATR